MVLSSQMDFCQLLWTKYREVAEQHGRTIPVGEEAAWGGYLVLADTQAQAEAWAHDCLWFGTPGLYPWPGPSTTAHRRC